MLILFFCFLSFSIEKTCLYKILSAGVPEIYFQPLIASRCLLLLVQDNPVFISFFCSGKVRFTKYSYKGDSTNDNIIYTTILENSGKIERVLYSNEKFIFDALEISNVTITISSFKSFNCSDVLLDSSRNSEQIYNSKSSLISTKPTTNQCYFYGVYGTQTVSGFVGKCTNCPQISLYEGQYKRLSLQPNSSFSHTQLMPKYPILILIEANENSDLDLLNISSSTDANFYQENKTIQRFYKYINRPKFSIDYQYTGDILTVTVSVLIFLIIIFISIIICCKEFRFCRKHPLSQHIEPYFKNVGSNYPLTNGKNYQKYINSSVPSSQNEQIKIVLT